MTADVELPWTSELFEFPADAEVRVSASAPEHPGRSLHCEIHTDQGPFGRIATAGGSSTCELARSLRELGTRR